MRGLKFKEREKFVALQDRVPEKVFKEMARISKKLKVSRAELTRAVLTSFINKWGTNERSK